MQTPAAHSERVAQQLGEETMTQAARLAAERLEAGERALQAWTDHVRSAEAWWLTLRDAVPRTRAPLRDSLPHLRAALTLLSDAQASFNERCPTPAGAAPPEAPELDAPEQRWAAHIHSLLSAELRGDDFETAAQAIHWGDAFLHDAGQFLDALEADTDPARLDWMLQALHDRFNAWSAVLESTTAGARTPAAWSAGCPQAAAP